MENDKIRFENMTMAFPGVLALNDVSFGIKKGCTHVLMGENGAGKSTLMKILNGAYTQTSGTIYKDGEKLTLRDSMDAEKNGIAMIHQELNYIPDISVERYLMLCREPQKYGFINWKAVNRKAKEILKEEELSYNPKTTLRELSVSDIQLLEITKVIKGRSIEVLIMDEPTSALSNKEVERLFENIEKLKKRGITIIYISHKMDEIFRVADYITVMRDGCHIKTAAASEFTPEGLVKLMVGREISDVYPKEKIEPGEELLRVEGLTSYKNRIENISFHVRAGEIVGLGGLMGAGRSETARTLFGIDPADEGNIYVEGRQVSIRSVVDAIRYGISMATEDRRRYGLVMCRNIKENISLSSKQKISTLGFIHQQKETKLVEELFEKLKIKANGIKTPVQTLSGGNQQKVVLSKWMMTDTKILILDEPTRGIDVGAKFEIYKLMTEIARKGIGIIMISSELPEFIGMCDRAYIMYKGKITGELKSEEMTQEKIAMLGAGGEL